MPSLLDPTHLAKTFGHLGIFVAIFVESGIVIGFILPGDSLLFAAGLLASQKILNLPLVIILTIVAAILGNNFGYYTGKKAGHEFFHRRNSWLFSKKRIDEAHDFFEKKGGLALILARFTPAVRCFVPIIAGIGQMNYRHFVKYNAIGAILWGISMPVLGYSLGKTVHGIDKYILPLVLVVAIISIMPILIHYYKSRRK